MNLLLATIDSLRVDYVSRTNDRIRTPEFDRCSREFLFSDRCFSVSSATRPVHASLFTGLYPFEHGILGQRHRHLRPEIPRLFDLFVAREYGVAGFSEAPTIFTDLDLGLDIELLESDAATGHRQVSGWLDGGGRRGRFGSASSRGVAIFLHYWGTHTPYGAADRKAMGETARLLRDGCVEEVERRYMVAVTDTFENKLAPLLRRLDPQEWCVIIVGDHGESWRVGEELYHGQSLRNSVLRVPLYVNIPYGGAIGISRPIVSIADLFPTLAKTFDLPVQYDGFARDIREEVEEGRRYLMAQIHPLRAQGPTSQAEVSQPGDSSVNRQWAIFDHMRKFTYDEDLETGRLEETFTERLLEAGTGTAAEYLSTYDAMRSASAYAPGAPESAPQSETRLDGRLRELGYLD